MPTIQHRCNAAFATWAARCARLLLGTALLSAIPLSAIAGPPPAQCFFTSDHVHEGTAFRIYRSDNCGPPALTKHPLIVFSHGDGFGYKTYDAFMKALVGTSAIVVSVDQGSNMSNAGRADMMLEAIDFIYNVWDKKGRVNDSIAFIGHSRGGEAVLTAAREYRGVMNNQVDAIISLMSTDNQKGGGPLESLTGITTKSYLSLVGTRDEDVLAYCMPLVVGCSNLVRGGLSLYDRAGTEWGPWDVGGDLIDKSAKRLPGFTHGGWTSPVITDFDAASLETQRAVVHDYVTRFLRWQLFGELTERAYFTTAKESALATGVVSQYVQHTTPVQVIDTFENGVLQNSDTGKQLVTTSGPASFSELPAREHDLTAGHDTDALAIQWAGGLSKIRWTFPKSTPFDIAPTLDTTPFPYLSLRATRIFVSAFDISKPKLRIRLTDVTNAVADVVIGDDTPFVIPEASISLGITNNYNKTTNTVLNSMATLRIPLRKFTGIDRSAIRSIAILVGDDSPGGAVMVDSIELTH